jgi:hypothetical protein
MSHECFSFDGHMGRIYLNGVLKQHTMLGTIHSNSDLRVIIGSCWVRHND